MIESLNGLANDVGNGGHMDEGHMMDGWFFGNMNMWFWWISLWAVMILIGLMVYKDAEKRRMNGLLWFLLVIIPWIGILFLIVYVIIRNEPPQPMDYHKSPSIILDERFARGEIDLKDYRKMKKEINKVDKY